MLVDMQATLQHTILFQRKWEKNCTRI